MDLTFSLTCCAMNAEKCFKVLELYSGIGGIHSAFHACRIPHKVVAAMDINTTANAIYRHNFPDCSLLQRNIQSLTVEELDNLIPDIITMSPPCQPFTRQGLKKDVADKRTDSFIHVLQTLSRAKRKVPHILLENVKGFENSEMHRLLLKMLEECGYDWREFLLTPSQFGIPNSRLRYYLLAKTTPFFFAELEIQPMKGVLNSKLSSAQLPVHSLRQYLEDCDAEGFLLDDKVLSRYAMVLDIVNENSKTSCCFTKGYGHYIIGTGSVLQSATSVQMDEVYRKVSEMSANSSERIGELRSLKLRYFTPREICNLMQFPICFDFPKECTRRQKYQVLGNSVNVFVVAQLLEILLHKSINC